MGINSCPCVNVDSQIIFEKNTNNFNNILTCKPLGSKAKVVEFIPAVIIFCYNLKFLKSTRL